MTSTAYRQSSAVTPVLEKADPDNQLVSRMPLRRMDAEVLNDTMLVRQDKDPGLFSRVAWPCLRLQ